MTDTILELLIDASILDYDVVSNCRLISDSPLVLQVLNKADGMNLNKYLKNNNLN